MTESSPIAPMSDFRITRTGVINAELMARVFRVHSGVSGTIWWTMCCVVGFLAVGGSVWTLILNEYFWSLWLFACAILLLKRGVAAKEGYLGHFKKQLREMGAEVQELTYELTPERLRITGDQEDSTTAWTKFVKWTEGGGLILAYRNSAFYILIPIEQFDAEFNDALRCGLQTGVSA